MAVLHVRSIPDQLYRRSQRIARQEGKTLSALVISLLEQKMAEDEARRRHARAMAQIRRTLERRTATAEELAGLDLVRAAREERDAELERR